MRNLLSLSVLFALAACGGVDSTVVGEELCPGADPTQDADGDGIPDACDVCPAGADQFDADGDGIADACDVCDAGDDAVDTDGDTVADACDVCEGSDDTLDADGDSVPDGCDVCALGADGIDTDNDSVADACDVCPGDNPDDANGDQLCDSAIGFDIAHVSEVDYAATAGTGSAGVIINTGLVDIDLSMAQVVSVTDDSAQGTVGVTLNANGILAPGERVGSLSPLASQLIVDTGLVNEPVANGASFNLGFSMSNGANGNTRATVVIDVGGSPITLQYLFHIPQGIDFLSVSRVQSRRDELPVPTP